MQGENNTHHSKFRPAIVRKVRTSINIDPHGLGRGGLVSILLGQLVVVEIDAGCRMAKIRRNFN